MHLVIPGSSSSLYPMSVSGLLITHQPQSQAVSEGKNVLLECKAEANPPAQYKWYHNMAPMEQEKKSLLQVSGGLLDRVAHFFFSELGRYLLAEVVLDHLVP